MSQFFLWGCLACNHGNGWACYFCSRCSWAVWSQRPELWGSGTFLRSVPLQDFLLQIRTADFSYLLVPSCLSLWATDFTCRAILLLSLNYILQILHISAGRGRMDNCFWERNCVGASWFKKLGARWYLVKHGCHTAMKETFGIIFKSSTLTCFVLWQLF